MKKFISCLLLFASFSFSANAAKVVMTQAQKEKSSAVFIYKKDNASDAELIKAITTFEKYAESDPAMKYYFGLANIEKRTLRLTLLPDKGLNLIREASLLGDKSAQYYFAMEQIKSNNLKDGVKGLTNSARSGYPQAQYQLGKMYYQGNGVSKNRQTGFQLIKLAADKNIADAQYDLAKIYFSQEDNALKKGGVYWLVSSVKNGKTSACDDLYKLYKEGLIVNSDMKKHLYYLQCAAKNESVDAMKTLGSYLFSGTHLTKDVNQAMFWYKKAAENKDTQSAYIYAKHNLVLERDESLTMLRTNASKHEESAFLLGQIYKYGMYNVKVSKNEAIRYFEISKSMGNKKAIDEIISMAD